MPGDIPGCPNGEIYAHKQLLYLLVLSFLTDRSLLVVCFLLPSHVVECMQAGLGLQEESVNAVIAFPQPSVCPQ